MDELGKWLIGVAAAVASTVSGWLIFLFRGIRSDIAANKAEISTVKAGMSDKISRDEFSRESDRRRDDTIALHRKIDERNRLLDEKIDSSQKELRAAIQSSAERMDDKLDRILEKIK